MLMVADPICVQVLPLADWKAVNVLPLRTSSPSRGRRPPRHGVIDVPLHRRPALERDPIARRYRHHGMAGIGVQALPNHHPSLRPRIGVGHAGDPRHDGAIAVQRLIGKAESVGRTPDIGARAFESIGAVRITGAARQPHAANIPALPRAW